MKIKLLALSALAFCVVGSAHAAGSTVYEINTSYIEATLGGEQIFDFVLPQATTVTAVVQIVDRPVDNLNNLDLNSSLVFTISLAPPIGYGAGQLAHFDSNGDFVIVNSDSNDSYIDIGRTRNSESYSLAAGNYSFWLFDFTGGSAGLVNFQVTSPGSDVAAVPEPATYALTLAGLGALGFVARRRKSL